MKAKNIICKLFMLLCLVGLFELGSMKNVHAEMKYSKTLDGMNDIEDITEETTYLITPKETAVYAFYLKYDTDKDAYATLYNDKDEMIEFIRSSSKESPHYVYLKESKKYYLKISKVANEKYAVGGKVWIKLYSRTIDESDFETSISAEENTIYSSTGHHYLDMEGIYFDEKTRTLELNNFHGTKPIDIMMNSLYFSADPNDVDGKNVVNVKITGENSITLSNTEDIWAIYAYLHVKVKFIGDGVLNIKFDNKNKESKYEEYGRYLISGLCDVIFDGPTINVEEEWGNLVDTCSWWVPYGSIVFKSGELNVKKCTNRCDSEFGPILLATYIEMSGGVIRVDYEFENGATKIEEFWDQDTFCSFGEMKLTGGTIIITGDSRITSELGTFRSLVSGGVQDKGVSVLKGDKIDIAKAKVNLDKTEYKYDGTAKTPEVTIDGLKESVDFSYTYADNVKAGKAKVIIKGLGVFFGTKEVTFDIVAGKDANGSYDGVHGLKVGSKFNDGKLIYKVTKEGTLDGKNVGKVTVVGLKKKSLKKVSIKSILTINGVKYKVTAIGKKAFKNGKKLKSIVIGKNVSKISKGAFAGCKKLKSIKIKSNKIKKFVKGTFKGLKKTCVIKVPKAMKNVYAKKIKKAGFKGIVE